MDNERDIKPPRVSVILNLYDGEAYVGEAIDSVLAQTFDDWELICFDDHSKDGGPDIVRAYDDPRIHYHRADAHVPLGEARFQAAKLARGAWLAYLDQDDVWAPTKIQDQVALTAEGVGLVYGRTVRFDEHGPLADDDHVHAGVPLPEGRIFSDLASKANFIAMSSAMLEGGAGRAAAQKARVCEIAPDYHMFLTITHGSDARAVQEPCCWRRIHAENMSAATCLRSHEEVLEILDGWRTAIEPSVLHRRHRVYHTLMGFENLRSGRLGGLLRIAVKGSILYFLSRPFARLLRRLRRPARTSYPPPPR